MKNTTIDTKDIAKLPKCGRRWMMQNKEGLHIWCEPTSDDVTRRQVSIGDCLSCDHPEPDQTPRDGLTINEINRMKQATITETAPPTNKPHLKPRIFEDGTVAYPKRGWEPPPVPAGYRRKADDLRSSDAWIFLPDLNPCKNRSKVIKYSACGAANIQYQCELFGHVQPPTCQQCKENAT